MNGRCQRKLQGQSLLELSLLISMVGILVLLAIPQLRTALDDNYTAQQALLVAAGQREWQRSLELEPWQPDSLAEHFSLHLPDRASYAVTESSEYSYGRVIEPILGRLAAGSSGFAFDNLHTAELVWPAAETDDAEVDEPDTEEEPAGPTWYRYSRLSDEWHAQSPAELTSRPRALTSSEYLHRVGIENVQELLQWLPFGRSLRPDSLKFGYVNADIVPRDRLCRPGDCDD